MNKWVGASSQFRSEHLSRRQALLVSTGLLDLHDARAFWDQGIPDAFGGLAESDRHLHQSAAEQVFHLIVWLSKKRRVLHAPVDQACGITAGGCASSSRAALRRQVGCGWQGWPRSGPSGRSLCIWQLQLLKQIADERRGRTTQVYEAVLEFDYRIQVNKWFYAQPVLQYIIRPNGTGLVENATVLGFQLGLIF